MPCYKGVEYDYSLSKQGLSYVRWLKIHKPLEDATYLTLMQDVMEALPENLRYKLAFCGAVRGNYRYHGPTRQLRFIDNPSMPLWYMLAAYVKLRSEKERLELELLKSNFREYGAMQRAMEAERVLRKVLLGLLELIEERAVVRAPNDPVEQVILEIVKILRAWIEQAVGTSAS